MEQTVGEQPGLNLKIEDLERKIQTLEEENKRLAAEAEKWRNVEENRIADTVKYKTTLDSIPEAVIISIPGTRILESNKAAREIWGYSEEEFSKLTRKDLLIDNENFKAFVKERETSGKAKAELIAIKKTGEKFPVEYSTQSYWDPALQIFFVLQYCERSFGREGTNAIAAGNK